MKQIGSQIRETLEDSGYILLALDTINGAAILIDENGNHEWYERNNNFAGYVIEINGEGYEFCHSITN